MASERKQVNGFRAGGRHRHAPGFTLIEMMVAVAIMGIVAALAYSTYNRDRPRRLLASTADEIQGALKLARTLALSTGRDAAVLFFPGQQTGTGVGRVIVYRDLDGGFMQGTPPPGIESFCTFNSAALQDPAGNLVNQLPRIAGQIDLSQPILLTLPVPPGPVPTITFPYNTVPFSNTGCSFCAAEMTVKDFDGVTRKVPGRGAIRFDARGAATFYSTCGPVVPAPFGGSITLTAPGGRGVSGTYVLVVTPAGIVRIFNAG